MECKIQKLHENCDKNRSSFSISWEQRKLGEVGKTFTGLSGKTSDDFGHGEGRFVTYMNVFSNAIANPAMVEPIEIDAKQSTVKCGDVFFTTSSETPDEVGMSSIWLQNEENIYLNSFCFGYRLDENNKIDYSCLAYLLRAKQFRKDITLLAQGISRYNISKNKVMEILIHIPEDESEQTKIGQIFLQLDNLITLHQRKFKHYFLLLRGKFYDKNLAISWEQRKLGEITKITMGQSPNGINYTTNPNDAILVQGNADMTDGWVLPRVYTKQITKKAYSGDLIFSVRAPVGEVGKTQYNVVIGRGVAAISGNEFIYQCLKRMNIFGFWSKLSSGSTFESINSDTLKTVEFFIPKEKEQTTIGEFLSKLDNLITLHQRMLEKLKNIKKSLLEKMFV